MRFIRCILLVLLALNLPGWAFAAMPACSMQHPAGVAAADMHAQMAASMDDAGTAAHAAHCCPDDNQQQAGDQLAGTACQDGAHCQCGTLYQAAQPLVTAIVPAAPGVEQASPFHVITASALPHWRPPTPA